MAGEQNPLGTPGTDETQLLLEAVFTSQQLAALRAAGGLPPETPAGAGGEDDILTESNYLATKIAFGRLTEAPTNWQCVAGLIKRCQLAPRLPACPFFMRTYHPRPPDGCVVGTVL